MGPEWLLSNTAYLVIQMIYSFGYAIYCISSLHVPIIFSSRLLKTDGEDRAESRILWRSTMGMADLRTNIQHNSATLPSALHT